MSGSVFSNGRNDMSPDEQFKEDWFRFLKMKQELFSDLHILEWWGEIRWRSDFSRPEVVPYNLLKDGLRGLSHLFCYLVEMYCYARAAETMATECEKNPDEKWARWWRYSIRNYHFYDFIPRYFSFLDHSAHFVASLCEWEVLKGTDFERKRTIYYGSFWPRLKDSLCNTDKIGYLTQHDRKLFLDLLRSMDIEPVDPELNRISRNFRQNAMHTHFAEIDHMVRSVEPSFQKKNGKHTCQVVAYSFSGGPEFRFDELEQLPAKVIPIIESSLRLVLKTDLLASFVEQ